MFFKNDPNDRSAAPRRTVPALPLRDIIVFPHMVSQLFVGRERSIAALDEAMAQSKEIFLAAQRSAKTNDPTPDDIYAVGTLGTIVQLLRLADGTVKVLVEGRQRARVRRYLDSADFFQVELELWKDRGSEDVVCRQRLRPGISAILIEEILKNRRVFRQEQPVFLYPCFFIHFIFILQLFFAVPGRENFDNYVRCADASPGI